MTRLIKISAFLLVFSLFSIQALAQGVASANLRGTVTDPSGAVIPNSTVTARDEARGVERSAVTDGAGKYQFLQLQPGDYTITATAQGFTRWVSQHVRLTVGQEAELPIPLAVESGTNVVQVNAATELIETQRTSQATTVDKQRIDNLPINGRNYINFTLTNSQATRDVAPSIGAAPTSGLNFGGQRARSNLVNVDGVDAVDNSVNGIRSTVSQDAVQEFQIITNGYAAEYGRASGGVVNIITRGGTNQFHGGAFAYLRNRYIQATNPFSNVEQPAYTRVQPGATLSGPIVKDKTFFFFSFETTRRHESGFSTIGANNFGLVNFDASRFFGAPAGAITFKGTPEQAAFLGAIPNAVLAGPAGPAVVQYAALVGGSSGVAVNRALPAALAGPATPARFITTNAPLPASFHGLQSQVGNYPVFEGTSLWGLRIDHKLSSSQNLMLRANVSPSTVDGIQVNAQNQNFGQNSVSRTSQQTYRDVAGTAQHTWLLSPNTVNEFRFQYARRGLLYNFAQVPGGGDVAINIPGFAFFGREPFSFVDRTEQRYQFTDNFSWNRGSHSFKFGADVNHIPLSADFTVNFGALYNFGALAATSLSPAFGQIPGLSFPQFSPVQAYGLGIPQSFVQGVGNPHDSFKQNTVGAFLQDSWRIRPGLTLNYGVRYDVEFTAQFKAINSIAQAAQDALGITQGIPRDYNNVAPRVGLAWDPHNDGKTVIRASYGMFYDHPLLALGFDSDVADGAQAPQLILFGGSPCNPSPSAVPTTPTAIAQSFLNLNATNTFQGIQTAGGNCFPAAAAPGLQYLPQEQRFNALNANSVFVNQQYLTAGIPLVSQPFGFPTGKDFKYAYSNQVNFGIERDLGHDFSINLAYNFNGGHHLNRPINVNPVNSEALVANFNRALDYTTRVRNALTAAGQTAAAAQVAAVIPADPRFVSVCPAMLPTIPGINPSGNFVPAALVSFFRKSGTNPSLSPFFPQCGAAVATAHQEFGMGVGVPVPFSDMVANLSNGSSVYHGLTVNFRKRFSDHYEFLTSYTWSHAIDDSTDLQSLLAPQDSRNPSAERANSTFDQRHRLVFSGVYQTGATGTGFARLFNNVTVAPIIEYDAGRPFNILTGIDSNFAFDPNTDRPLVVPVGTPTNLCGNPAVPSKFSPLGALQPACFLNGTLVGNLGRNAGIRPYDIFTDLRIAKTWQLGERVQLGGIVDMFNIINRFNVADVNPLYTQAGTPTAAFDPRQFQFGLRISF